MTAVIVFGIILLVCAEEVIRLAKDARADMDSERTPDVFARRWRSAGALLRRGKRLLKADSEQDARARRLMNSPTVRIPRPNYDRSRPSTSTLTRT